jgi:hypothetical protein
VGPLGYSIHIPISSYNHARRLYLGKLLHLRLSRSPNGYSLLIQVVVSIEPLLEPPQKLSIEPLLDPGGGFASETASEAKRLNIYIYVLICHGHLSTDKLSVRV